MEQAGSLHRLLRPDPTQRFLARHIQTRWTNQKQHDRVIQPEKESSSRLLDLSTIRLGALGNQIIPIEERDNMTPTQKTLLERLDARILWNCAFNDPDEDTQLLIEAAEFMRDLQKPFDWQEVADRIFLKRNF